MNGKKESKALIEVRDWKKAVRKETEKLQGRALLNYYNRSIARLKPQMGEIAES